MENEELLISLIQRRTVLKRKVEKSHFCDFRFNTQTIPESEKRFFASKMSNSDSPHAFTRRWVILRKNFHVGCPLLCSSFIFPCKNRQVVECTLMVILITCKECATTRSII